MLAVMTGGFLLVAWLATKALFSFLQEAPIPRTDWQRHVLASSGYLEAGGYQLLWDDDPRLK